PVPEIVPLSLPDALPISRDPADLWEGNLFGIEHQGGIRRQESDLRSVCDNRVGGSPMTAVTCSMPSRDCSVVESRLGTSTIAETDRKSTRLNSSHVKISY